MIEVLKAEHRRRHDRVGRFRDEVAFHQRYGTIDGVLPVLETQLPDDVDELAWLVMPVAIPLTEALGGDPAFEIVLGAMATFAETLAGLASRGIGHRDIKPDNLFAFEGRWVVGDFGLTLNTSWSSPYWKPSNSTVTEHDSGHCVRSETWTLGWSAERGGNS